MDISPEDLARAHYEAFAEVPTPERLAASTGPLKSLPRELRLQVAVALVKHGDAQPARFEGLPYKQREMLVGVARRALQRVREGL